jgi:hypothetical protein
VAAACECSLVVKRPYDGFSCFNQSMDDRWIKEACHPVKVDNISLNHSWMGCNVPRWPIKGEDRVGGRRSHLPQTASNMLVNAFADLKRRQGFAKVRVALVASLQRKDIHARTD